MDMDIIVGGGVTKVGEAVGETVGGGVSGVGAGVPGVGPGVGASLEIGHTSGSGGVKSLCKSS